MKKELTKERKADNIYQVVSRTHQTISNSEGFVEKIEKKGVDKKLAAW